MVHEEQHSHVRAHGGNSHPHHHAVRVWSHLQGGAGMSVRDGCDHVLETIAAILIVLLAFI